MCLQNIPLSVPGSTLQTWTHLPSQMVLTSSQFPTSLSYSHTPGSPNSQRGFLKKI